MTTTSTPEQTTFTLTHVGTRQLDRPLRRLCRCGSGQLKTHEITEAGLESRNGTERRIVATRNACARCARIAKRL